MGFEEISDYDLFWQVASYGELIRIICAVTISGDFVEVSLPFQLKGVHILINVSGSLPSNPLQQPVDSPPGAAMVDT
jgi:hypothetical protein